MYFYLSAPPLLPRTDWQDWMWLPFLPEHSLGWAITNLQWWNVFWGVSEWLWKTPFTFCTNKWSSSCHQSKIDNSSDISYSIFWILRGVSFPWDMTATFLLFSPFVSGEPAGRLGGGEEEKEQRDLGWGKGEKWHRGAFFLFLTSSAASLSFRSLANGIVLLSHDEWSCFPTPHPSRVMEIGFRTKIKMILFLWTLELVMCFTWELFRGQSWKKIGETKIKGAQTNLKQTFFF